MKGSVCPRKQLQQKPPRTVPTTSPQKCANWDLEGRPADQGARAAFLLSQSASLEPSLRRPTKVSLREGMSSCSTFTHSLPSDSV